MKTREREKDSRDSILLILLILLVGFICIIISSGWALRFAPSWKLPANMSSNLNPDSDFLTSRPSGFYEPIDPAILTPPDWVNVFLTPSSTFLTRTPQPNTPQASNTPAVIITNTSMILPVTASSTNVVAPTNTLIYFPPPAVTASSTKKPKPPTPPATATSTPTATSVVVLSADLGITKTDNATDYAPNISVQYIIVANNAGPNNVTGATVTDNFSGNLTGITWSCVGASGASCTANGSGNINDPSVNLPVGGSVQYTVNATVIGSPSGSLSNTATISSGITDPNPGNNSATDTDTLISASTLPSPVGNIPDGTYVEYAFGTPLAVNGDSAYDLVYTTSPALQVDAVILQIGDGRNWYTIFNWGNGSPDANTDINPADCPGEADNCVITPPPTNPPGISIDVDLPGIPTGNYPYIRIISPPNPPDTGNDGVDVNNITLLP